MSTPAESSSSPQSLGAPPPPPPPIEEEPEEEPQWHTEEPQWHASASSYSQRRRRQADALHIGKSGNLRTVSWHHSGYPRQDDRRKDFYDAGDYASQDLRAEGREKKPNKKKQQRNKQHAWHSTNGAVAEPTVYQ